MSELNYEKDVRIDPDALDTEWLEQAPLMMKYTQHEARCRRQLEQAKTEVSIVEAELDKEIRSNPDKFDLPKITETAIKSAIQTDKDFLEAQENLREAEYELNMASAAVRSIYGKKDALENLVRLFGQQYFAGPKVPRDLSFQWQQKQEQIRSNKKVKIKRKSK